MQIHYVDSSTEVDDETYIPYLDTQSSDTSECHKKTTPLKIKKTAGKFEWQQCQNKIYTPWKKRKSFPKGWQRNIKFTDAEDFALVENLVLLLRSCWVPRYWKQSTKKESNEKELHELSMQLELLLRVRIERELGH